MTQLLDLSPRFLGDGPEFIPADNWHGIAHQLDWCLGFFSAYFAAVAPEEYYSDEHPKRTQLLQRVQAFERALLAIKCCKLCGGSGEETFSCTPGNEGACVIKVAPGFTFPKLVGTCPKCYGTGLEDA